MAKVKVISMLRRGRAMFTHGKIVECTDRDADAFIRYGLAEKAPAGAKVDGSFVHNSGNPRPERAVQQPGETAVAPSEPVNCKGLTTAGNQCKRAPVAGSDFCASPAHQAQGG